MSYLVYALLLGLGMTLCFGIEYALSSRYGWRQLSKSGDASTDGKSLATVLGPVTVGYMTCRASVDIYPDRIVLRRSWPLGALFFPPISIRVDELRESADMQYAGMKTFFVSTTKLLLAENIAGAIATIVPK